MSHPIRSGFQNVSSTLINGSIFGVRYFSFGRWMEYLRLRSTTYSDYYYHDGWNKAKCARNFYEYGAPVPTCGCFEGYRERQIRLEWPTTSITHIELSCGRIVGDGRCRCADCTCDSHRWDGECYYMMPVRQVMPHSAPQYNCTCGFYALYEQPLQSPETLKYLRGLQYNQRTYIYLGEEREKYVLGVVEGKGKTIIGDKGFRSEFLKIRGLVACGTMDDVADFVDVAEEWQLKLCYPSPAELIRTFKPELDMNKALLEILK